MRHGGGSPLSPVTGEWLVHEQPNDWRDTDPVIHGKYNHNIVVTMNVAPGTKVTVLMKAGDEVISHYSEGSDLGFQSYPPIYTDGMGGVTPSGIDTNLVGLQFIETRIIVREKEYYDRNLPVTVEVEFKQGGRIFSRTYKLSLTWDHFSSGKENPFICDLVQLGVPLVPTYEEWNGWQPITGEFIYSRTQPTEAMMIFNGYWIGCFAENVEVNLKFQAFEPFMKKDGPGMTKGSSIGASLDLCHAGLKAVAANSGLPNGKFVEIREPRYSYYLLQTKAGTYVFEYPEGQGINWHVFFTKQLVTSKDLVSMLGNKDLWFHHDFEHDPLGHHRVKVGGITFWEVMNISHPPPACGGTHGGSYPSAFLYGVMDYIVQRPLWWMRFGSFPNEI